MRSLAQIVHELESKRDAVQREVDRLNTAIGALKAANSLGGVKPSSNPSKPRRTMSAAARKRIAVAQKARWAAWKAKQKKAA